MFRIPFSPLLSLLVLTALNTVFADHTPRPCNMGVNNVMYQRDTYYLVTNMDGRTIALPNAYRYRMYDTNGFLIKNEDAGISNGTTNSHIDDNIRLMFLSGSVIEWDGTNGIKDNYTEFDRFGRPVTLVAIQDDGTVSQKSLFATRLDNDKRYQIETDCCSGKKSMTVYRNNLPVLEVVDNYRYGQPLYKYFYYYKKKLAVMRGVMRFGPHEETMYHIVYTYDARDRLVREERLNLRETMSAKRVTVCYSYDSYGNMIRCEEYCDDRLSNLHITQYVYWNQ